MFDSTILTESRAREAIPVKEECAISLTQCLLEMNNEIHKINVDAAIFNYRLLKEDAVNESSNTHLSKRELDVLMELSVSEIKDKIKAAIQAVINFIIKFINMITQRDIRVRNSFKRMVSKTHGFELDKRNHEEFTFTEYHYPSLKKIDGNRCKDAVTGISSSIERICRNEYESATSNDSLSMAYKDLARIIKVDGRNEYKHPVTDRNSFTDYVKTDIIYSEKERLSYREWRDRVNKISPSTKNHITSNLSGIKSELERMQSMVSKSSIIDADMQKNVNMLISQIQNIIAAYTWFLEQAYNMETMHLKYVINTFNRLASSESVGESGFIHGEPFNSDTLFDNEDLRDFNRTEWLNLQIATELCQMEYEFDESRRRIALKEALIMSDNDPLKFKRLLAMREAEDAAKNDKVDSIFTTIRKFVEKFLSKLVDSTKKNAAYLTANKAFIDSEFKFENVKSTGDILAGMQRVQELTTVVPFNYETMKDDLKDKNTFFERHVLQSLKKPSTWSKRSLDWNANMSVSEYCKKYFGAGSSDNGENKELFTFTKAEINQAKGSIIAFLNKPNIITSINTDFSKLERESKKVVSTPTAAQPAATANSQQTTTPNNTSEVKPQNASAYYSDLYNTWLHEIEVEHGENKEGEVQNNTNTPNEQAAAFKVYADCYRDVFMAKITGAEFITRELMSLMQEHAKSYGAAPNPTQTAAPTNTQNTQN